MDATEVINLNPTTREEAILFADKLVNEVEGGMTNPLDLHIKLTAMEKAITDVKQRIKQLTMDEVYKYGLKSFEHLSARIDIAELGIKYEFSACGDIEWETYDSQISALAERKKSARSF